jgi:hypothetical protein
VATATTTPAITLSTTVTGLLKGNGTAISAASSGTDYAPATSGSSILYGNGAGGFSNVTIGSGLTFTTGTLTATGSGGTVTSVSGTGTVNGITLTGTVTSSGSLTLGGTLSGIGNSQLTNSTISGVALGGSLFNLTAGTGVTFSTGTTYNGSAAITINATGTGGTVTSVAALTLGTTGTDLSSTVANGTTTPVITLNVPTASSVNRGALSAADWTTFNSKAPGVTFTTGYIPFGQGTTTLNQDAALFWDNTNKRLGIGTVSPATKLELSSATGTATPTPTEVRISTTSNASDWSTTLPWGRLSYYNADASTSGPKIHIAIDAIARASTGAVSNLSFSFADSTSGVLTERMLLTDLGNLSVTGTGKFGTTVGVGAATPSTSGAGITFPATQSASTDVNTLDDYEEGTFTPTVIGTTTAGTGTYSANSQIGRYTKIGNRVYFNIYLAWTAHTGTGNMRISGLPFTSIATTNTFNAVSTWNANIALTALNLLTAYVNVNATTVELRQYPTGGGADAAIPIDTAASIMVAGHYEV